jgi:hypothetical protein
MKSGNVEKEEQEKKGQKKGTIINIISEEIDRSQ